MTTNAEAAWEQLRAGRWNPPGNASANTERRRTYQTALEQAEQMFAAAAGVGTVARPLLAFYGLSQAGRAIAAAARTAGSGDWKLSGHGIRALDLDGPLTGVIVKTDKPGTTGSFVRLSELLGSPVWHSGAVSCTDLWDQLPENSADAQALHDDLRSRRTPLDISPNAIGQPHPIAPAMVGGLPGWLAGEPDVTTAFKDYLANYPTAAGYVGYVLADRKSDVPRLTLDIEGRLIAQINWETPDKRDASDDERAQHLHARARWTSHGHFLMPETGATGSVLHPLMAWWALLFALSMLARYQPAAWMGHIDINHSRHAQPLEKLLTAALESVPPLIAHAVREVS